MCPLKFSIGGSRAPTNFVFICLASSFMIPCSPLEPSMTLDGQFIFPCAPPPAIQKLSLSFWGMEMRDLPPPHLLEELIQR